MKPKYFIVFIAILATLAVVACTKSDRTTGPAITVSDLPETEINLAGNSSMSTATTEWDGSVPQVSRSLPPTLTSLCGLYFKDKNGCVSLQQLKEKYVDLTFKANTPIEVKNGVPVEVQGTWSSIPDSPCHYGPSFEVYHLSVLVSNQTDVQPDRDRQY